MNTLAEQFKEQFYEWEIRGRGWLVWPEAVTLEPPFTPFYFQPRRLQPYVDDLRKPTLWSELAQQLDRWFYNTPAPEIVPDLELPTYGPELFGGNEDGPLVEIQLALPPQITVGRSEAELFLAALGYCACPMSFEVIGSAQEIVTQIVSREHHLAEVRNQLRAYFPEAVLTEKRDYFSEAWQRLGRYANIVDFGLKRECFVPLRVTGAFNPDPLVAVVGAMAKLRESELGIVQVLFQPVQYPWAESMLRATSDANGGQLFATLPEIPSAARRKINSPLYSACIRIATTSDENPFALGQAIGSGFAQFGSPETNSLIALDSEEYQQAYHVEDLLTRRSHRSGMLLSAEELCSLVHPPSASVRSAKLIREVARTKAAPTCNGKLILGLNVHQGEVREIRLTAEDRTRHMYVLGASGTGKSTFLLNLILQDIEAGEGVGVLDPHGDLIDQILAGIPPARYRDVVLVDPGDEEWPVAFNILQAHSETEKNLLASDLVAIFRRQSTSWGDQMNSVFANAILAFLESDRGGTLADLRRFLVDPNFREKFLPTIQDREIAYYWKREFPLLKGGGSLGPILTRLDTFLRPKLIRRMVAQKENRLNFGDIMDSGKIFLARLSQGAIGEENAYLLGTLLLSKFHQIALARQGTSQESRRPFWLTVDECHHFLCPSMLSILSGVRKYKLGLTLAHQELRQLGHSGEADSLIANPYTRVHFRLSDADAAKLAAGFTYFDSKDFLNLSTGNAIARVGQADHDFNLAVSAIASRMPEDADNTRQVVIATSRNDYARARAEVDAELEQQLDEIEASYSANDKKPLRNRAEQPVPEPQHETPFNREQVTNTEPEPLAVTDFNITPLPASEQADIRDSLSSSSRKNARAKHSSTRLHEVPAPLGRGGRRHQYVQHLIKQWAEGMGYLATIEKPIPGGSIDVLLEKEGVPAIACEISVTTDNEHELANIRKCLEAGYSCVAAICSIEKRVTAMEKLLACKVPQADGTQVWCVTPEQFFQKVEELESRHPLQTTATIKGYKVRRTLNRLTQEEQQLHRKLVSDIVASALQKTKR